MYCLALRVKWLSIKHSYSKIAIWSIENVVIIPIKRNLYVFSECYHFSLDNITSWKKSFYDIKKT